MLYFKYTYLFQSLHYHLIPIISIHHTKLYLYLLVESKFPPIVITQEKHSAPYLFFFFILHNLCKLLLVIKTIPLPTFLLFKILVTSASCEQSWWLCAEDCAGPWTTALNEIETAPAPKISWSSGGRHALNKYSLSTWL